MSVPEQKFVSTLRQGAVYFAPTRVGSPNYHFCADEGVVLADVKTGSGLVEITLVGGKKGDCRFTASRKVKIV